MNHKYQMLAIGSLEIQDELEQLLRRLHAAGFSTDAISLALADHKVGSDPADEPPREGADKLRDLAVGAASGGAVLGTLGGLIGLASLAIPGLGLLWIGGPLAVALGDAMAGGAVGAVAGALMGMRIPDHQAKQTESSPGGALVSIYARDEVVQRELKEAMNLLADAQASDLHRIMTESRSDGNPMADSRRGASPASSGNKKQDSSTKSPN
jgi:hypothetical protein